MANSIRFFKTDSCISFAVSCTSCFMAIRKQVQVSGLGLLTSRSNAFLHWQIKLIICQSITCHFRRIRPAWFSSINFVTGRQKHTFLVLWAWEQFRKSMEWWCKGKFLKSSSAWSTWRPLSINKHFVPYRKTVMLHWMNRWIAVMTRTDHTQAMQNIVIQVYRPISYENPACYENCSQGIQLQPEN